MAYKELLSKVEAYEEYCSSKYELIELAKRIENGLKDHKDELERFNQEFDKDEDYNSVKEGLSINSKREAIDEKCRMYSELLNRVDKLFKKSKFFDCELVVKNIRYLFKKHQDIKIGSVERYAGVGIGYLSRISKADNSKDPSIEFIVTVAKIFDVNISDLLNYDLEKESVSITPNEMTVHNFIKGLLADTNNDTISWTKADDSFFSGCQLHIDEDSNNPFDNYTFEVDQIYGTKSVGFKSVFYGELEEGLCGVVYKGVIKKINSLVYILPISYHLEDGSHKNGYEIYVVNMNKLIPICSTLEINIRVGEAIDLLYKSIQRLNSKIQLNPNAKNIIMDYLS